MMDPTRSREMPSCSAIDLAEIRPAVFQDQLVNLVNNLRGGHCFGSSKTRRITGGKSPSLKWATQFLTVAYNGACPPNVSEWRELPSAPCLTGKKKNLMTARVSMLLKSRASPNMLPFSLCNKKILAIRHMNRPLFPTTLSIPSYDIGKQVGLRTYQHPLVLLFTDTDCCTSTLFLY